MVKQSKTEKSKVINFSSSRLVYSNSEEKGNNQASSTEETSSFTNISPRRGSLPSDYNRPSPRTPRFPLHSPTTPNSPSFAPNYLAFSPTLSNFDEVGEVLDDFLDKSKNTGDKILNKLLKEKENDIRRLEKEKEEWLIEKQEFEESEVNQTSLLRKRSQELRSVEKKLERLETELKESNDDFYQETEKTKGLNNSLNEERLDRRKLEKQLAREIDENHRLKNSQEQINQNLLVKINELGQLKKLERTEKEQWQKIITEQEEKYQDEKKEREQEFAKTLNNLRLFQTNEPAITPIKKRLSRHNKSHSFSSPSSPRSSYIVKDEQIIFSATSPRRNDFQAELSRKGYEENGGIIGSSFTTTPQNEEGNPFEVDPTRKKRHSNSPLFNRSSSPLADDDIDNTNTFEELLDEIVDLGTNNNEQPTEDDEALRAEVEHLKADQAQLEKAYKTLADEQITNERLLQGFNQEKQEWSVEKQKLIEELAEMKYQLSEANAKHKRLNELEKRTRYQLQLKEDELKNIKAEKDEKENQQKLELEELKKELEEFDEVSQEGLKFLDNFKFETRIEINKK